MAKKFQQGIFTPNNPTKYVGKRAPRYRSGWELAVMRMADAHPNVIAWGSETHRIPYRNPITGKQTTYVPDFLMVYEDKNKNKKAEMIEVKPSGQTLGEARGMQQKAAAVVNQAKWEAANAYAKQRKIRFRVVSEEQLFHSGKRK